MSRQPSQPRTQARVAADPDNPASLVDSIIDDRYRLTSLVGRGGMGSVFLAEHVTIRRPVALKLLSPSLAAIPELARRFEREAAAIGRIDHPNCVTVSDFGRLEGGSLYLVMEYLDGRSLSDAIEAEGRIAARRALHIARHVLRGLGHAHQAGIVHRDVKPDNVILVQQDGVPDFAKVLDFGIAHFMDAARERKEGDESDDRLTQAGIAFGTPQYMSPEQAVGDPVDPRADLYATTVMLFEMIAGRTPFVADEKLELLGMHATRPPPRLSETRADLYITPELDRLIEVGLAKRPSDRFASAEQYIAAIEEVLHGRVDGDAPSAIPLDDTEPVPVAMDPRLRAPARTTPLRHTPNPALRRRRPAPDHAPAAAARRRPGRPVGARLRLLLPLHPSAAGRPPGRPQERGGRRGREEARGRRSGPDHRDADRATRRAGGRRGGPDAARARARRQVGVPAGARGLPGCRRPRPQRDRRPAGARQPGPHDRRRRRHPGRRRPPAGARRQGQWRAAPAGRAGRPQGSRGAQEGLRRRRGSRPGRGDRSPRLLPPRPRAGADLQGAARRGHPAARARRPGGGRAAARRPRPPRLHQEGPAQAAHQRERLPAPARRRTPSAPSSAPLRTSRRPR